MHGIARFPGDCFCFLEYTGYLCSSKATIAAYINTYVVPHLTKFASLRRDVPAALVSQPLPVDITNASLIIDLTSNSAYPFLQVSVAEWNPFTKVYVPNPLYTNAKISVINAYLTITGLTPGRCEQVVVNAYTSPTVLSSTIFWKNDRVRVTCGCPTYNLYDLASTESTGAPADFQLTQSYGKMFLKWTDRSLCESGFSFERGTNAFTPTYFIQSSEVCWLPHAPVTVYDDLVAAQLQNKISVGSLQTYCIRAINPIGCDNSQYYSSESTCVTKLILWESAIRGIVKGKENIGSAPIEGVEITWSFVGFPEVNGTAITNHDGLFVDSVTAEVGLDIQSSLLVGPQQIVISVYKKSGSVVHEFTCEGFPCTNRTITLNNLDFDTFVNFVDASAVLFSGSVVIADTAPYNGGHGCPIANIRVCAVNHYGNKENLACTTTNAFGEYSFPIAAGLSTEIRVYSDANHTFVRLTNKVVDRRALFGYGTAIPAGPGFGLPSKPSEYFDTSPGSLSNIDYEDIAKTLVNVELAGGNCNRTLGDAMIVIKRDQCPNYRRSYLIQTFQTPLLLPSQQLTVNFDKLTSPYINFNLEVRRYLHAIHNDTAVIDIRNATDPNVVYTTVRFEYHPEPTLRIDVTAASRPKCTNPKAKAPLVATAASNSNITVYVSEQFPGVAPCDDVSGSLNITNFLGELGGADPLLTVCRDIPCNISLIYDELFSPLTNTTHRVNSRAELEILIGYPSLFPPFTKSAFVRMPVRGHIDAITQADVIVTGFKWISDSFSVQLPEYMPLMVLHDPPGG